MSASKQKGTRAETAVVGWLQGNGFPYVERRTTRGANDAGDVAGIPGVVIEVKDCQRMELAAWIDEAERETDPTAQWIGVVWHKRARRASPGDWYVTMDGATFAALLFEATKEEL